MRQLHRSIAIAAVAAVTSVSACSLSVEGDTEPTYGEVTLSVVSYDDQGAELSRDVRSGAGADLVAPLDRELYDAIVIDGAEVTDPSGLFAAREARVGEVALLREADGSLKVTGDSLMAVRSARRSGAALEMAVDGGRFEIAVAGQVSAASLDRIFATALIRTIRGEALLADDCRPDCIYDFSPVSWLCGPMRDILENELGGECAGPYTPEEWAAIEENVRNEGKRDQCYDNWWIPRPLCEWGYNLAADAILPLLEPDESGLVCASTFYDRCTGAVDQ